MLGERLAASIGAASDAIQQWARDWAAWATGPLVEYLWVPVVQTIRFVGGLIDTAWALYHAIVDTAAVAAGQVGLLASRLTSLTGLVGAVQYLVNRAWALATSTAASVAHILATDIPAAVARAVALARSWAAAAIATAVASLGAAIAAVRALALAAVAALARQLTASVEALRAWATALVGTAVGQVAGELDVLRRLLAGLRLEVDARLGAIGLVLAPLLALELTRVIPWAISEIQTMRRQCVDPTCDFLGTALNGLGAAGQLLEGSVLAVLVAEAIRDPEGTATEVAGWSGELRTLASNVTEALAGRPL